MRYNLSNTINSYTDTKKLLTHLELAVFCGEPEPKFQEV